MTRETFTFSNIVLAHTMLPEFHAITHVSTDGHPVMRTGPALSKRLHPVISYEWRNRFFIAQCFTENLPPIFELVKADETLLITIDPPGDVV